MTHKAMMIAQGFNMDSADIETSVEHCERAETTDDITGGKFSASDEDSETRKKNASSRRTSMVRNSRSVPLE